MQGHCQRRSPTSPPPEPPQALHSRSGLTLPPRLEVPVHWRGLHVGGKLRQRAGEFFSADHREGEGGRGRAHGDVSIRGAVRGRGAGPHGHVAVLGAVRCRAQRGEPAWLHGQGGTETAPLMHSQELLWAGDTPELRPARGVLLGPSREAQDGATRDKCLVQVTLWLWSSPC